MRAFAGTLRAFAGNSAAGRRGSIFLVRSAWVLAAATALTLFPRPGLAKLETWRQQGAAAFSKHQRERVVITSRGRARLGQSLLPIGSVPAERVWDLARTPDGTCYAATGDSGKVYRRTAENGAGWTLAYQASDTQALSLVATAEGKVFVGTGPSGQVIELTDPMHPGSRPEPRVEYVWDLAADAQGNLYAATGPTGQLWKRSRDGQWSLLYDSKQTHLLSVAVGADGAVFAGTDGAGLIYRLDREGKVSVLYDAPQSEVRALLVAPDGSLYAGTAGQAGGGGTASGSGSALSGRTDPDLPNTFRESASQSTARLRSIPLRRAAFQPPRDAAGAGPAPPRPPAAGSAPRPASPGDNAVFQIDADGVVREVFRAKALVHALAWSDERLYVGTGPEGQLFEVRPEQGESTPLAKLDAGSILSLLNEPGGGLLLGTGDPGSIVRLSSAFEAQGELVSEVHDAKLPARFGAVRWRGETPPGTTIAVQVRTGNVGIPDETWSPWSAEQTDPNSARAESPLGRFVQYKVKLATKDPRRSPELTSMAVSYRSANLPPEINRLEVPDVASGDAAATQGRLVLKWDVSDPNDDDLSFLLEVRKEGWPSWIALTENPITDKSYTWDTKAFPSGTYQVRLVASDRPSNSPDESLTRAQESESFLVDHDPPVVTLNLRERGASILLEDSLTRLVKAEYALDGGPWKPLFPDDGLFDTNREQLTLSLPELQPGAHLLMVRAVDAAGNVGSRDAILVVGD
jgi:hypothetical protein